MHKLQTIIFVLIFAVATEVSADPVPKLQHVVCVKLKASVTEAQIAYLKQRTLELKNAIPVIEEITAGKNLTQRSKGFDFAIVVRLKDRKSLETYRNHESHLKLLKEVAGPLVEEILVLDFEI